MRGIDHRATVKLLSKRVSYQLISKQAGLILLFFNLPSQSYYKLKRQIYNTSYDTTRHLV